MARVSVIIANYNGLSFLQECLPSLQKTEYPDFEVVICDDASIDESVRYLQSIVSQDPRFKLFQNEKNSGAAKTRNNALKHAHGEIIVFLDNDTQVEPNWLNALVNTLDADPHIGGVQSALFDYHEREKLQHIGVKIVPHTCWGIPIMKGQGVAELSEKHPESIIAITAAMAVRKSVIDTIGGFDEVLAVYTEDLEFSLRIWIAGYRIVSCPQSIVYHWAKKVSDRKTMNANREQIYFHMAKNSLRTVLKNYQIGNVFKYLPQGIIILIIRAFIRLRYGDTTAFTGTAMAFARSIELLYSTLSARQQIQSKVRKVQDNVIFDEVATSESLLTIYRKYF